MRIFIKTLTTLFLSLLLVACSGGSPESVAKQFVENVYEGNAQAVLELVEFPDSKNNKEMEELVIDKIESMVAKKKIRADRLGGVDDIITQPFEVDKDNENRGHVIVEIRFNKGKTDKDRVNLIKTDAGWKVRL